MNEYRFILDKSSRKFICPNCHQRRFVRYIDTKTNEYLPEQYGRCDREYNCRYHFDPYTNGYAKEVFQKEQGYNLMKPISKKKVNAYNVTMPPKIERVFIPFEILQLTRQPHRIQHNIFINNLKKLFTRVPEQDFERLFEMYQVGTIIKGCYHGAVTFPFIDINNNIHAIQVKLFDENNHTVKTTFIHALLKHHYTEKNKPLPDWLNKYLQFKEQSTLTQTLFGSHLLNKYPNPIGLVEAPKTALYATLFYGFPDKPECILWLAVYNKSSLNIEKLKVLKGRTVFVFPDNGALNDWKNRIKELEKHLPNTRFIFSTITEQFNTQLKQGYDIADLIQESLQI